MVSGRGVIRLIYGQSFRNGEASYQFGNELKLILK